MGSDDRDFNGFRGLFFYSSASMGHINTIGSLDRTSLGPKAIGCEGVAIGEVACRSMATLSRLATYGGEAPPPYEWTLSLSVEEVVSAGANGRASQCDLQIAESFILWCFAGAGSGGASGGERA